MKLGQNFSAKLEKLNVYKCENCPNVFPTVSELAKHMSYHKEFFLSHIVSAYVSVERAKIFTCDKCTQTFYNNRDFMLHKLAHIQVKVRNERKAKKLLNPDILKPYKCPECELSFVAQSTLDAHSVFHLPFPHICECGIGYYQENDLKGHIKLVHGTKTTAEDNVRPKRKPKVIPHTKPQAKSKKEQQMISYKSVKKAKPKSRNRKVTQNVNEEDINSFKQIQLPEFEVSKPDIVIRRIAPNKFECPECKKLFGTKGNVIQHYRVHTGEHPFTCHLCPKSFTQPVTLKRHLVRHYSPEKTYVCKYCPKAFTMPEYRQRHEQIHSTVKLYNCSYCGKGFNDQSALIRHKRIHTGDKRYRCPECPKAFSDVSALIGHKLRHEKKKQFQCTICDKRFYNRSDVKKHTNAVHTKQSYFNFTCDYCKRSYTCKYNLEKHIEQIHMKITKPFKCAHCPLKFSKKSYLKRHIKEIHQEHEFELFDKLDND